jgi:hypothetical protein
MNMKRTSLVRFVKRGECEKTYVIDDRDTAFEMIENYSQAGWSWSINAIEHIQEGDTFEKLPVQHKLFS